MTTPVLAEVPAPQGFYRLARGPDPWAFPDWANAQPDGTFGNRFDDPSGTYRVLYACTQRVGTFIETLARFRPAPKVVAGLAEIDGDDDGALAPGELDVAEWVAPRRMGRATATGTFADLGHSRSLAALRTVMAGRLEHYGLEDLDAATVRLSAPRRLTQEVSAHVYAAPTAGGGRFAGVAYRSRLGDELQNWALFEPAELSDMTVAAVAPDDPDLITAAEQLGVRLR